MTFTTTLYPQVIDGAVEMIEPDVLQLTLTISVSSSPDPDYSPRSLGEGPTKDAIPDRIVRELIRRAPEPVRVTDLQAAVGGNPATVQRQVWTLASDGPDLQLRLRGWVTNVGRGLYALSPGARAALASASDND